MTINRTRMAAAGVIGFVAIAVGGCGGLDSNPNSSSVVLPERQMTASECGPMPTPPALPAQGNRDEGPIRPLPNHRAPHDRVRVSGEAPITQSNTMPDACIRPAPDH